MCFENIFSQYSKYSLLFHEWTLLLVLKNIFIIDVSYKKIFNQIFLPHQDQDITLLLVCRYEICCKLYPFNFFEEKCLTFSTCSISRWGTLAIEKRVKEEIDSKIWKKFFLNFFHAYHIFSLYSHVLRSLTLTFITLFADIETLPSTLESLELNFKTFKISLSKFS